MRINKVQSVNLPKPEQQNFKGFGIEKTCFNNIEIQKLRQSDLSKLQQVGEYLGVIGEKGSTEYFDVILDNLSYYIGIRPYPLKLRSNSGAYVDAFEANNCKATLDLRQSGSKRLNIHVKPDYKNLFSDNYFLNQSENGKILICDKNFDYLSFGSLPGFAQLTKLMDIISGMKNDGKNIFDKSMAIILPGLPKVEKAMSADEIIAKYGVEP